MLQYEPTKALYNTAAQARELARILDATGYLEDKVFQPEKARIVDLKLKLDLQAVQDQIQEMFNTKESPQRGFVYIAWSARPEEYWYVGKASTVERLKPEFSREARPGYSTCHQTVAYLSVTEP